MTIQINGRLVQLPANVNSVKDLLEHYELQNRIVVVELNKEIVLKEQYSAAMLSDGDLIEMIHFVGGG